MLATILVLAAIALYLGFLFRIAFARLWQPPANAQTSVMGIHSLFPPSVSDPDYAALWESQMPVLALLRSGGRKGVTLSQAKKLFEEMRHRYPELYDGSTFGDWLDWLQRAEVAHRQQDTIAITEKGLFLLEDDPQSQRLCEVSHRPFQANAQGH